MTVTSPIKRKTKSKYKKKGINFLATPGFWSIVLMVIISIKDPVSSGIERGKLDLSTGWDIIQAIAAYLITLVSIHQSNEHLFTPKGLPGRNQCDVEPEEIEE